MNVEKIAVVGASGYSGEELIRLLLRHPAAELVAVTSRQWAGQTLDAVFPRFAGQRYAKLAFIGSEVAEIVHSGARVVFLALPHGVAAEYAKPLVAAGLRVIDLSADFRIKDPAIYEEYYGEKPHAPELAAVERLRAAGDLSGANSRRDAGRVAGMLSHQRDRAALSADEAAIDSAREHRDQ